jgi:hypothetical protein
MAICHVRVGWKSILFESYSIYSLSHVLSTFESCSIYCCNPVQSTVGDSFFNPTPVRVRFYLLSTVGVMLNITWWHNLERILAIYFWLRIIGVIVLELNLVVYYWLGKIDLFRFFLIFVINGGISSFFSKRGAFETLMICEGSKCYSNQLYLYFYDLPNSFSIYVSYPS